MIYDVSQLNLDLTMIMTLKPWFPCWRSLQQPFQFGQHQWCPPRTVRCDNFDKTRRDETNLPPRFCKGWQRSDSIGNDGYSSLFEFWEKWSLNAGNAVTILPQWDPNIILHNHHVAVAVHKTTSSMEKPKYSKVQQVEPWEVWTPDMHYIYRSYAKGHLLVNEISKLDHVWIIPLMSHGIHGPSFQSCQSQEVRSARSYNAYNQTENTSRSHGISECIRTIRRLDRLDRDKGKRSILHEQTIASLVLL